MSPSPWSFSSDKSKDTDDQKEHKNQTSIFSKESIKESKKESNDSSESPLVIVSEIDAYVRERLKSQPKTIEEIQIREIEPQEGKHRLSLPSEIEKALIKRGFVARWINKDKRMIDRAIDIRKWIIFTRVYFPEISKHYFTANGVVEHGDSILAFMPAKQAEKLRMEPGLRSMERIKNLPIDRWKNGGDSYYKPSLTEEKDGESITSGIQPDRQMQE